MTVAPGTASSAPPLSLSDLVERTGVPASTIHHYRRSGLIPPPRRQAANRFAYGEEHVEALLAIRAQPAPEPRESRDRIVNAAIEAFKTRSYADVSVNDIAEAAQMAKGNVYRYFSSKEALLTAAIEKLLEDTAERFGAALESMGGADQLGADPERSALALGYVVADVLPILLELGARAAKGHEPSADLGRKVLRTLAATAGHPLVAPGTTAPQPAAAAPVGGTPSDEAAIAAGLGVIETAFATVLSWAVGPDWPPDHVN